MINCHPIARDKRAMEASLPPITDEASLDIRKKIMEQQELREFKLREQEFDTMREKRLEVLRRAIDERDAGNEFLAEQRVEALRQRRMEDRDKAIGGSHKGIHKENMFNIWPLLFEHLCAFVSQVYFFNNL